MNLQNPTRQATVSHQRLDETHPRLHRRWLRLLQALWSLLVLYDLFILLVSLPAFYQVLQMVCTGPIATCFITDQLLPQELITLHQAGISLHPYALAVFCLDLVASLAFLLVGAVIIWRKANTWMGLFVSFLLINFGSLGLSLTHEGSRWLRKPDSKSPPPDRMPPVTFPRSELLPGWISSSSRLHLFSLRKKDLALVLVHLQTAASRLALAMGFLTLTQGQLRGRE